MAIIRSKVTQNYTVVAGRVIEDKDFSSKYIGTFLRLISKGQNWEISADGLAALYPTEGRDFYRNALKHMCKLGYLIRIPQSRENGKFTKCVMELYDTRQFETPLTDEEVDKLFSIDQLSEEEIKKIYPQRVSRHDETNARKYKYRYKEEEEERLRQSPEEFEVSKELYDTAMKLVLFTKNQISIVNAIDTLSVVADLDTFRDFWNEFATAQRDDFTKIKNIKAVLLSEFKKWKKIKESIRKYQIQEKSLPS